MRENNREFLAAVVFGELKSLTILLIVARWENGLTTIKIKYGQQIKNEYIIVQGRTEN
jgi:hypothetical protein